MPDYIYPRNDLDRAGNFLELLGSFWAAVYDSSHQVESVLRARLALASQTYLTLLEAVASVSRFDIPLFHTDLWQPLLLLESERNGTAVVPLYGTDGTYTGEWNYGTPAVVAESVFPAPTGLHRAPLILDRLVTPQVTYTENVDFWVDPDNGFVAFRTDPFQDARLPIEELLADGEIVDRQIVLWVYRGQHDLSLMHSRFGYVVGLKAASSQGYKDLINAYFDALVEGCAKGHIEQAFSAMTGIPTVKTADEVVQELREDAEWQWVITDQNAYALPQESTITVSVGDVLARGRFLSDDITFFEFHRGEASDELRGLALGRGFLAAGYYGELTFENKTVPLEVSTDENGYTRVQFEIGGFPLDVAKFWDDVHEDGVAAGQTLANLLDKRANPVGQPGAASLPSTVNPLEFMLANFLRNNAFVVRVKLRTPAYPRTGLQYVPALRKLIPPHTALILLIELSGEEDPVTLDAADGDPPSYSESGTTYLAMEPGEDEVDPDSLVGSENARNRVLTGRCT